MLPVVRVPSCVAITGTYVGIIRVGFTFANNNSSKSLQMMWCTVWEVMCWVVASSVFIVWRRRLSMVERNIKYG